MPNKPRIQKADKGKYDEKAFLDYAEACDYLGVGGTTLYHHIIDMGIQTYKFPKHRRRYLAISDVRRIEAFAERPWQHD